MTHLSAGAVLGSLVHAIVQLYKALFREGKQWYVKGVLGLSGCQCLAVTKRQGFHEHSFPGPQTFVRLIRGNPHQRN